jgi:hypothetical protein
MISFPKIMLFNRFMKQITSMVQELEPPVPDGKKRYVMARLSDTHVRVKG